MNDSIVSVILPAHNGEKYISKAIDSVLNQTYKNIELIVVDDFSVDSTQSIVQSYNDPRVKYYYSEKNRHIAYSLNKGISLARGEYIARIDCDDIWELDKLEKQIQFLDDNSTYGAVFSKVNVIDENGTLANDKFPEVYRLYNDKNFETQKEWLHYFLFYGNVLCHSSVVMRKDVLDIVGNYNLTCVPGEDFELWTRIATKYPIKLFEEKMVKCRWCFDENKVSSTNNLERFPYYNIQMMVRYHFFDNMSNSDFIRFSDDFVCTDSMTEIELECEKAFILLNSVADSPHIKIWGWLKLYDILLDRNNLSLLEEKYNFNLIDLYKQYDETNFNASFLNQRVEQLVSIIHDKEILEVENKNYIDKLAKVIDEDREYSNKLVTLIHEKEIKASETKEYIDKLNQIIKEKDEYSSQLTDTIMEQQKYIETIHNSLCWKILKPFRYIKRIMKK